ncbi:LysR family transcriptional regulator [Weeksellaceae bacterium TAE3-ERU29]|nr:LysR family transcriptional regulator [Weeksellaceae bacterium TAE3-ERU29]
MNTRQYDYILAVAELKNFGEAAEKCFITQSTLSTMIKRFEDEIGISLFDRKTKPITITKEGKLIIEQLKIIRREIKTLDELVLHTKGELSGELNIGVIPTVAPYLLPLFLGEFSKSYPKVNIIVEEMTTIDIQKSLKNGAIDVGIGAIPLNDNELIEKELYQEPFLLFDCHSQNVEEVVLLDNIDFSHLFLLEEGHCLRTQVEQICQLSKNKHTKINNLQFKTGSIDSLIRFTKANKGITLLPYLATLDLNKKDKKRLASFFNPSPVRAVGLITHQNFVKKKLLGNLAKVISKNIEKILLKDSENKVISPNE